MSSESAVEPEGPAGTRGGTLGFRLGSVPVLMPWSTLVGIGIIAFLWLDSFQIDPSQPTQALVLALVFAVLFYACILGHELAHAWAARLAGFPVRSITLWALGGYTSYERREPSPGREALIAASGPISSVLIGVACNAAASATYYGDLRVYVVLHALGFSNVILGIYNALPGLPLDGGAVLKAVLWGVTRDERRSTVVAAWAGRVVAVLVFLVPQYLVWRRGGAPDLGSILIGLLISSYLYSGASQVLAQARIAGRVPTLSARELAVPAVAMAHDTPLSEALRLREEAGARSMVAIDSEGRPRGVSQESALAAVPAERRPWVPLSSVCVNLDARAVLVGDLRGEDLINAMLAIEAPQYLVIDPQGGWYGTLARADVERVLAGHR
ncbi:MAG: site-2 protease family protein [Frankiales bacterium]|nr:site-2 protease family protein [Frankiales bacterium]